MTMEGFTSLMTRTALGLNGEIPYYWSKYIDKKNEKNYCLKG